MSSDVAETMDADGFVLLHASPNSKRHRNKEKRNKEKKRSAVPADRHVAL